MKRLLNIDINKILRQVKQIQLDIISIKKEDPVMLTEVTTYIRPEVTIKNNHTLQALANFFLTKKSQLSANKILIFEYGS